MEDPGYREEEHSSCGRLFLRSNPSIARYIYSLIFLVTSLLAWTIRDYGRTFLSELRRLKGCHGASYCLGAEGVLRISAGCSMFFFVLFVTTLGTKKLKDVRNSWHSEWWAAKMLLWMSFMTVPFFLPSEFFFIYGESHIQVMIITIASHVASTVACIMMYIWYAPKLSCRLNILFISLTFLLLQIINFVSIHQKVRAGYLAPGLMGAYIVFLCWCAIRSEPRTEICNLKAEVGNGSDWHTIASFVIAIVVIVVATFSTGMDSECFQFTKIKKKSEGDIPYGYGFFHFVFTVGSMYFGMLFVGWDAHKTMKRWTIDVGWAS
ncbi:hypothetical protein KSP40_PGU010419 [Platanthera guangdongensis]|uniref:Serine incorporator n=1 Tax=Platanthera guangdongensis TaxID=2320717 RepID=A0ABR2MEW2_9ASPA